MKITIIAVGKLKEDYLRDASSYFSKLISKHSEIEIIEVPDEKTDTADSPSMTAAIKNTEGTLIRKKLAAYDSPYIIALAIDGENIGSDRLKRKIIQIKAQGKTHVVFIIGGSLGLSDDVLKAADYKLSFSPMTFPHQLMRIMLLEQISKVMHNS